MSKKQSLKVLHGVAVSAAVALAGLYAGMNAPLPKDGFVPGSFVTHSVMLALSLLIMRFFSRGRLADFGFTRGTYRFKPAFLLWVLPTALLSLLSTLAPENDGSPETLVGRSELQLVLFAWIYASICEEVLTRGLLQTIISGDGGRSKRASFGMPVVLSALFFGAMHLVLIDSMGPAAVIPIVLATLLGLVAARYRQATGSLIPAILVHVLFNVGGMLPQWIVGWLRFS
jgi:membrane protease YdiL (CAAX protease family)